MRVRRAVAAFAAFAAAVGAASAFDPLGFSPQPPRNPAEEEAAAPAVVLLHEETWRIEGRARNGEAENVLTVRKRVLINDDDGRAWANQSIVSYEEPSGREWRLTGFAARTALPDGRKVELTAEMRHEAVDAQGETKRRELKFTFPAVAPGAVLEWEYELRRGRVAPWPLWDVQESIPVREATFVARRPAKSGRDVAAHSCAAIAPWCAVETAPLDGDDVVDRVVCRDVPAYAREPLSPPEADTRLRMFIAPRGAFDDAEGAVRDRRLAAFEAKRKTARELAAREFAAGSPRERFERIGAWIAREIALVPDAGADAADGGPNKTADALLESRAGTAEEAAMLAVVLAEEAGVDASLLLAHDVSRQSCRLPTPERSEEARPIAEAVDGRTPIPFDPSCRHCRPGIVSAAFCGGSDNALRVSRATARLHAATVFDAAWIGVPCAAAETNVLTRRERIELAANGSARVAGEAVWAGQLEQERRDAWSGATPERRATEFLDGEPGSLAEARVETGDPDDLSRSFAANYSFAQADAALAAGGTLVVRPRDVVSKRLGLPVAERRRLPLWWPRPFTIEFEQTFVAPEGYAARTPPPPARLLGAGLSFEASWRAGAAPNELVYRARFAVAKQKIVPQRYASARAFALALKRALAAEATFERR